MVGRPLQFPKIFGRRITCTNTQIGFALRGNTNVPSEKEDSNNAEDQAVNWFKNFIH